MRFNHLNIPNQWKHYWTKYPEGYTILESLLNWVAQVDSMVDNVNNWNDYLDNFVEQFDKELQSTVSAMLNDWKDSGFLADIINNEVFGMKADKTYVDKKVATVSVKEFGAVGDSVTDDTTAIRNAIAHAQSLVRDRFLDGATVLFPKGSYLITGTLTITSSNINLQGESHSSSVLYAPNASFDLVHFNGTDLALYAVGMNNLRLFTPTNASAGKHLRVTNAINSMFDKLYMVGWYDGIAVDGGGKVYFDNIILSQENRTAGNPRYGIDILGDRGITSDIHFSNIQVMETITTLAPYSISIRSCDGLYFSNCHFHGGTVVQPSGTYGDTLASVFYNNCYFDKSVDSHFVFTGSATTAYRNFMFTNCYFRDAVNGVVFNTTGMVNRVLFVGCHFSQIKYNGVDCKTANNSDVLFTGCMFSDNNVINQSTYADMNLLGTGLLVSGCVFQGGGNTGNGVIFKSGTLRSMITGCNFTESTTAKRFTNNGSACKVGALNGVGAKNRGSATVASGTTSIVVNHGIDLPITGENIEITPRTNPMSHYFISNVTATQFTVNLVTAPTANVIFTWVADATA